MTSDDKERLARIETKIDAIMGALPSLEERTRCLEVSGGTRESRLNTAEEEIEKLRGVSTTWGVINSIGAIIAGAIGSIFGSK